MANIMSFSEFDHGEKRGVKRRAPDDETITLPMAREYAPKVRDIYPFHSVADIYKTQGLSDRFIDKDDPSAQLIPETITLPSANNIDYTLLSADIICKYWSLKKNMTTQLGFAYHHVRDYVKSTEAIADGVGGVAGMAAAGIFAGSVLMVAPYIGMYAPLQLLPIATTSVRWLASPVISGAVSMGIGAYGSRKVHNYVRSYSNKRLEKRRREEAIEEHISEVEAYQKQVDAMLARLKGHCVNIYSVLCENRGVGICRHREPYKCREKYLQSFKDIGKGMMEYMKIPDEIAQAYKEQTLEDFTDLLKTRYIRNWGVAILTYPGAANEVGLILSILYIVIQTPSYKNALADAIQSLFNSIYNRENPDLYEKMAQGCFVSMLMTDEDAYVEWVNACVMPRKDDEKTEILSQIWDRIEKKLGMTITEGIRGVKRERVPSQGNILSEAAAPNDGDALGAERILHELGKRYGKEYIKDPIGVFMRFYNEFPSRANTDMWVYALIQLLDADLKEADYPEVILDRLMEGIVAAKYEQHRIRYQAARHDVERIARYRYDKELRNAIHLYIKAKILMLTSLGRPHVEVEISDVERFQSIITMKRYKKFEPSLNVALSELLDSPD